VTIRELVQLTMAHLKTGISVPGGRLRRALAIVLFSALLSCAVLVTVIGCKGKSTKPGGQQLDFNQDVQPILASNCFSCHGPDPEMRKGGLRLDLKESAFKSRPGHPDAIVPGHPEQSELIKRIESKDSHHLMPQSPQGEAKPMKPEEIAVLKEWIKEGAVYRPHWAFEQPVRVAVPAVKDGPAGVQVASVSPATKPSPTNPIDGFILARLRKEGLKPSPEAQKETQIRRATLDLTGLLPAPDEVSAFVKDLSPAAYERLVNKLLASPRFGEQRTRYWLDYARYADTYGLHYDNSRDIWPYRDYLIRSFNGNKPFDQFAMEQIAGDMLPAKTIDPLIGSGYVRLGVSSNEGGTIPEELRTNIARERAEAYGAAFMGLTVGCAVCHDHKYDPTTQKDFYSLTAFFNNMDERVYNNDRPVWEPVARIPKPQNQAAYNTVLAQRSALAEQMRVARLQERTAVAQWVRSQQNAAQAVSEEKLVMRLRMDEGGGDTLKNSAPHAQTASYSVTKGKPEWGETTWLWPDFRMQTSTRVLLGQTGDYEADQPFSVGGWMMLRAAPNFTVTGTSGTLISKMDATQHDRGWDLTVDHGTISVELVHQEPKDLKIKREPDSKLPPGYGENFHYPTPTDLGRQELTAWNIPKPKPDPKKKEDKPKAKAPEPKKEEDKTPQESIKISTIEPMALDSNWKHIFFTYDGSGKASGVRIYIDGIQAATHVVFDSLGSKEKASIRTTAPMQLGWRYPDKAPAQMTRYQDIRLYSRTVNADEAKRLPYEDYLAELVRKPLDKWNADEWHIACDYYFDRLDKPTIDARKQIQQLNAQLEKLSVGGDLTLVSWDKQTVPYAHVLTRGVYSARAERVEANTPHFLPPLPAGQPHNRLALAKWTVSAENPLTARVVVNRMWAELFGAGLVETTEDFGIMGQRPSNPELLDWLAVEFRESGWDMKHMYKLMAMSAAYRQSAKSTPEQLAKDPKNMLLSHGPRFRMDAEMLRDIALQSGGLLAGGIGGPSVKPYQPANVWEQVSYPISDTLNYHQGHGEALYRRSMYTYWKRMAILPDMDAFDAAIRDVACTRRQRTDTPLQALVTMNDVQWVEAARALAQRVIRQGGTAPEQRIRLMSELLLSHDPSPQMTAVLINSLGQMKKHYGADQAAAGKLIRAGETKPDASIPPAELAAWTMLASEMLNLDETVTK
jgi:hypothetical protein